MKNGGKNKSVAFIILFSIKTCMYTICALCQLIHLNVSA